MTQRLLGIEDVLPALKPTDRTLDVGCGGGEYLLPLLERVDFGNVFGIDLNTQALVQGQRMLADAGVPLAVQFIQADAVDLPFRDNYFRLVSCYGMLHGPKQPERVLREMMRVLAPGGTLVCFTFKAFPQALLEAINAELVANQAAPLPIHPGFEASWLLDQLCRCGADQTAVREVGAQTIATPPYTSQVYKFPGILVTACKRATA